MNIAQNGNRNISIQIVNQIAMKNEFIIFYQGSSSQNMEMTKMGITKTLADMCKIRDLKNI